MIDLNEAFAEAVAVHQAGDFAAAERTVPRPAAVLPGPRPDAVQPRGAARPAGRVDEAGRVLHRALAATPGHPDAHFNLGNLLPPGQPAAGGGRRTTGPASPPTPPTPGPSFNLGLVLSAVGDRPAAAESFRRPSPGWSRPTADAHSRLGDALVRAGRRAEGVAAFREAVELRPDDPRRLYNLGLALAAGGETTEAHGTARAGAAAEARLRRGPQRARPDPGGAGPQGRRPRPLPAGGRAEAGTRRRLEQPRHQPGRAGPARGGDRLLPRVAGPTAARPGDPQQPAACT